MYLKLIYLVITSLPQVARLIASIQKANEERATREKIKKDLEAIDEAFKNLSADELRRIFKS
jgi:prephenate dehydrogenase